MSQPLKNGKPGAEIIGHGLQRKFLKKSSLRGNSNYAFLFSGTEGIGKKRVALEFIKFINCREKEIKKRPCNVCFECRGIENFCHADFLLIEPENSLIAISKIRDASWFLSLTKSRAEYKAVLIDEAHCMNEEAQNSLLKTLEEPAGKSVIILTSSHPRMLLKTVRSRVEEIKFFPASAKEAEKFLKQKGALNRDIEKIIKFSSLKQGKMIDFLENPQKLEDYKKELIEASTIANLDLAVCFEKAKVLSEDKSKAIETLGIWLRYFRGLMLKKLNPGDQGKKAWVNDFSFKKIKKIIETIEKIKFFLSGTNVNPRLAIEFLILEIKI